MFWSNVHTVYTEKCCITSGDFRIAKIVFIYKIYYSTIFFNNLVALFFKIFPCFSYLSLIIITILYDSTKKNYFTVWRIMKSLRKVLKMKLRIAYKSDRRVHVCIFVWFSVFYTFTEENSVHGNSFIYGKFKTDIWKMMSV